MSERARILAEQLEQANRDLIHTVEGLSDTQWRAKTPGDGRTVGVVAHHVAASHKSVVGLVGAIAHGQAVPTITMEMIHEGNATHATQHANCTKAETVALLRQNGAAAVATVRGLSETELDRTATFPMGTMTAAQVIERILTGHANDHHGTIRRAIGA
jgi:DinB family protein